MHHAHILVEGTKFSKSLKNTITLRQLVEHGYDALSYRYWLLTGHYRTPLNFSFTALEASQTALKRMHRMFAEELATAPRGKKDPAYTQRFMEILNRDLDTPRALALVFEVLKDTNLTKRAKRATLLFFDKVLSIGLTEIAKNDQTAQSLTVTHLDRETLPQEIRLLVDEREDARTHKDWQRADSLRKTLSDQGYHIEDRPDGPLLTRDAS
jgi:cysteinyl-tRNA synthetase